jgi:hypothetical protein
MSSHVEQLDRNRRRMLAGFLAGFLGWQLPPVLEYLFTMPPWLHLLLAVVVPLAGIAAFGWFLTKLVGLQKRLRREPALASVLRDERYRALEARVLMIGFWVVVLYLAAARLVVGFNGGPDAAVVTQLGLILAIATPIVALLWLERDRADAE